MSPIVYTPHDCKTPRSGDSVAPRRAGEYPPEGTVWACDVCGDRWELEYAHRESRWYDGPYSYHFSYYEIEWHRL